MSMVEALASIEKDYGKGAVVNMGTVGVFDPVEFIPTGALTLDLAIGGGIPRGRITEIIGPESTGKSTLCLHVMAEAQKMGATCLFIDTEHAFDPTYATALDVDMRLLQLSQPDDAEQALEIADRLAQTAEVAVIIIDSVAGLVTRAELNGQMGDAHVGTTARLMNQALRKLTGTLGKTNTACIFTNQLRSKIGVFYGSNETTPGGAGLKYFASVRLDMRRIEQIKDGSEIVGNRTKVKVIKNKIAVPFKVAEFDIIYGRGIVAESCVLDLAVDRRIVNRKGAYYVDAESGENLGQGREKAKTYLKENPGIMEEYRKKILDGK